MNAPATPVESILADANYRAVWLAGVLLGSVRWLEFLAIGIYAYAATGSPFLVALLALLRFLPLAMFGVFIGALADLMDGKRLLGIAIALTGLTSVVMSVLFAAGVATYWQVAVATFLSGMMWAADMPLRRKLIGEIAGMDRLATAMSLDIATSNGTRLIGPLVAGLLYQGVGPAGIFLIAGVIYASAFAVMARVKLPRSGGERGSRSWIMRPIKSAARALVYAARDREVACILAITVVFNIIAFPMMSMVPVIGKDELGLGPFGIGAVTAIEGAFAFIGAMLVARYVRPAQFRRLYFLGTCALLPIVLAIGLLPGLTMLALGMVGAGLAGAGFATMQSTLMYLVAPADMRGRLFGLLTICIGAGLFGFVNLGLMAELFGPSNAFAIIALEGMIPMVVIGLAWPQLRAGN